MTIVTDPLFYLLAIPAVTLLGLGKGGFAGIGMVSTPLLALSVPPLQAAAVLLPILLMLLLLLTQAGLGLFATDEDGLVGGPLSLVQDGDEIELSVAKRSLTLHVSEAELAARREAKRAAPARFVRGYGRLFMDHINQADQGCDFDFLEGTEPIGEPEIH